MIDLSLFVALGLLATMAKLPWRQKLWCTSHPLLMDAIVFVGLIVLHWGTFSGVMVASIGAFFCSIVMAMARRVIGYVENGHYVRGFMDVSHRVK